MGGVLKIGYPQIIHFNMIFHSKASSYWGTPIYGNHIYIYIYELQPKFRLMESSIQDIVICWKLSWGLENDNTLFKKR